MNFQQLRFVREAVRRNFNLTDVAAALYATQPGVSRAIKELEDELAATREHPLWSERPTEPPYLSRSSPITLRPTFSGGHG